MIIMRISSDVAVCVCVCVKDNYTEELVRYLRYLPWYLYSCSVR